MIPAGGGQKDVEALKFNTPSLPSNHVELVLFVHLAARLSLSSDYTYYCNIIIKMHHDCITETQQDDEDEPPANTYSSYSNTSSIARFPNFQFSLGTLSPLASVQGNACLCSPCSRSMGCFPRPPQPLPTCKRKRQAKSDDRSPSRSSSNNSRAFASASRPPFLFFFLLSGASGGQTNPRRRLSGSEPRDDVVDEPAAASSGSVWSALRTDHHGAAAQPAQRDGAHRERAYPPRS